MAYLTRDQILAADDIATEVVDVPEWGGEVLVKGLTGRERDQFEESILVQNGKTRPKMKLANMRAKFVALSIVDDGGRRIFDDADIESLGQKSAAALQRVFEVAQQLSGLSDDDLEELEKN